MLRKVRFYQNLFLLRIVLALFTLLLVFNAIAQAQFDEAGEQQLLQLINQERADRGLPQLAVDQRLTRAARKHSELMIQHKALAHQFDGESTLPVRFADENLHTDRQAENIGLGNNIHSAHKWFMLSPAHRANILNPNYSAVGVGVARTGEHVYVTEDFAHSLKDYSEPEADAALQRAVESYARSHGMPAPVRKPQSRLRQMACEMALNDSLREQKAAELPGVEAVATWTTGNPDELPKSAKEMFSHSPPAGYSLGACFAPSVSQPGGVYWVVMVVY